MSNTNSEAQLDAAARPAGEVVPAARRHVVGDPVSVAATKSRSGLPQTERTCTRCGVVKVTVHERGGGAHREWRWFESGSQFSDEPPCITSIGGQP